MASAAVGAGTVVAQPAPWAWRLGDDSASLGQQAGSGDLLVSGLAEAAVHGRRLILSGEDGNFEFESFSADEELHAYPFGSARRTPLALGAPDGQDVTALVVSGRADRSVDVQQWSLSGEPVTAIDLLGRLRIDGIVLDPAHRGRTPDPRCHPSRRHATGPPPIDVGGL